MTLIRKIGEDRRKYLPRINADERGLENAKPLTTKDTKEKLPKSPKLPKLKIEKQASPLISTDLHTFGPCK